MRIVVFPGNYFKDNLNLGDLAIYESLMTVLPREATVHFVTHAPDVFQNLSPRARAIPRSHGEMSGSDWESCVTGARLVLASGGSYFSDLFPGQASDVLAGLDSAHRLGIPTAILGAAFEPLKDRAVRDRARAILPRVGRSWVRDRGSVDALEALGVAADRIDLIADPSLELCHDGERDVGSARIGVNLRDSPFYNPLPFELREIVRLGLRGMTREVPATVCSLPISLHGPDDDQTVRAALPECEPGKPTSVRELLDLTAGCRVVLSGSHHAAALALGCGVPALMVGASAHYLRKLRGLAGHFGDLAPVVDLASTSAIAEIDAGLRRLWTADSGSRNRLRETTRAHVIRGRAFVDDLARGAGYRGR